MQELENLTASEVELVREVVDSEKYAITDCESEAYKLLITECRKKLNESGYCLLNGFIRPDSLKQILSEAKSLSENAFHKTLTGNAYLTEIDNSFPEDHPRRLTDTTALAAVASDQMPSNHLIKKLYNSDILLNFIKDCLSYEKLYRYADSMSELNLAFMKEGDYLRWHFDQTDFVVSILIENSISGGEYQVVPGIRSKENENYDKVKKVLHGSLDGVKTLDIKPGCLVLFQGKYSIHRVTKVEGERSRIVSLLAYDIKPDTFSSDYLKMIRYGRTK